MEVAIRINFVFILLICSGNLKSQSSGTWGAYIHGYSLFHPGFEVNRSIPIVQKEWETKNDKEKEFIAQLKPGLGFYHHWNNHTGTLVGADVDLGIKLNNLGIEIFGGLHYLRAWNANPTYELESGEFIQVNAAGNNYLNRRFGLGVTKLISKSERKIKALNLRIGASQPGFPGSPLIPNFWMGIRF